MAKLSTTAPSISVAAILVASLSVLPWLGDLRERGLLPALAIIVAATLLLYSLHILLERTNATLPTRTILGIALLLRLVMLPMQPSLSDDAWRYLWDGRLVVAGINPYLPVPADPSLAMLHDKLYELQGYPTTNTIYPPGAQLLFAAAMGVAEPIGGFRAGYIFYKLLLIAIEMSAIVALLRLLSVFNLPRRRAILYAWHPLAVVEIAGQGHTDALWVAALLWGLYSMARGSVGKGLPALFLGGAMRLYPLGLVPLWWRWLAGDRATRITGLLLSLPAIALLLVLAEPAVFTSFTTVLARFTNFYEFNGGFYRGVKWLLDELRLSPSNRIAGMIGTAVILAVHVVVWLLPVRGGMRKLLGRAMLLTTIVIVLGAKVHIWYFVAPLALVPLLRRNPLSAGWLWLTAAAPLTYLMYAVNPVREQTWVIVVEWVGFLVVVGWGMCRRLVSGEGSGRYRL